MKLWARLRRLFDLGRGGRKPQEPRPARPSSKALDADLVRETELRLSEAYRAHAELATTRVSVIMPAFNRAQTIERAMRSVLQQTHREFELIVVDDGSTDDTVAVARRVADARVKVVSQSNGGVSSARNAGLREATGQWIAYLDSDNVWTPRYLEFMLAGATTHMMRTAYAALKIVDEQDALIGYHAKAFDFDALCNRNYIDMNVFMHKRELVAELGGFDERFPRVVDWDLIVRYTREVKSQLIYFIGCHYTDGRNLETRLTRDKASLYTKIVRAKNVFFAHSEGTPAELLRLARLRIALKVAAPAKEKQGWGDWYYAIRLQKQLILLGYDVHVLLAEQWDGPEAQKADIHLTIQGLRQKPPQRDKLNLTWCISHPNRLTDATLRGSHHVFVASARHASYLRRRGHGNVSYLPQAIDTTLFRPDMRRPAARSGVLFVGNTRGVDRPVVTRVVASRPDARVIGAGWRGVIPAERIAGEHVANEKLPKLYRDNRFVLSDVWDSMREFGYVADRIYQALACGAIVVGDRIDGIEREGWLNYVFCDEFLADPEGFSAREPDPADARRALARHSFATAAAAIDAAIFRAIFGPGTLRDAETPAAVLEHPADAWGEMLALSFFGAAVWEREDWRMLPVRDTATLRLRGADGRAVGRMANLESVAELQRFLQEMTGMQAPRLDPRLWRVYAKTPVRPPVEGMAVVLTARDRIAGAAEDAALAARISGTDPGVSLLRIWPVTLESRIDLRPAARIRKQRAMPGCVRERALAFLGDLEARRIWIDAAGLEAFVACHLAWACGVLPVLMHEAPEAEAFARAEGLPLVRAESFDPATATKAGRESLSALYWRAVDRQDAAHPPVAERAKLSA